MAGDDGYVQVEIEGFDSTERRPGAPDVPTRTVWIAIPPDAEPTLDVRVDPAKESVLPGIVPRAVLRRSVELSPEEREAVEADRTATEGVRSLERGARASRRADRRYYESDGHGAATRVAWLGETGYVRDQRYVEVHLAPVRFDPAIDGLRIQPAVEVVVEFHRSSSEPLLPSEPDPRFEGVYRSSFLNYDQSRSFRGVATPEAAFSVEAQDVSAAVAATPLQRILVTSHGLVRLDYALLQPTGFLAHPLSTWKLTNRGVGVPLQLNDDGDGTLEPGESVQFYGQALDDEPKTEINTDFPGTPTDLFEARDFTDENTYFLSIDPGPVAPMPTRDSTPTFTRVPPQHFKALARAEVDNGYRPLGGADPWYWLPTLLISSPSAAMREDVVPLPGLFSGTEPATVRVKVRGIDEDLTVSPDHPTRVTLRNNATQVLATNDGSFDNRTLFTHQLAWTWPGSGATLSDPARVKLEVLSSAARCSGSPCNSVILDWIEIDYERAFTASGNKLVFDWPDSNAEFSVAGFTDPSPAIYEITLAAGERVIRPVRLTGAAVSGAGPYMVRFRVDQDPLIADGSPRRFAVLGSSSATIPGAGAFQSDTVSDLRNTTNQADLVVIASEAVLDASPGGPLAQLLAYRATAAGGGLTSKVVRLQDVYDEFGHGLPGPTAIREFLRFVLSSAPGEGWSAPKPAYVLLLGDGSADYKSGFTFGNYVPTQILFKDDPVLGFYASDNVMAAVVGADQLADLVVGRVPARSVADANRMLQKILSYELSSPAGAWRDRTLFVSDRGKLGPNLMGESLEFELINAEAAAWVGPPATLRNLRYYSDYFDNGVPNPWNAINAAIKATVNGTDGQADGVSIVNYIGHGNFVIWSDDFFWDERVTPPSDTFQDSLDLHNAARLSWLVAHNCLTGGFQTLDHNSIGENWFKLDGGGAVGVFAPTGLSTNFVGGPASQEVFEALYGPTKERVVGPIVLRTLAELCTRESPEACQAYALQGDPATKLVLRDVDAPSDLVATAGNARVDLAWTASSTPGAVYDVYRAESLQNVTYVPAATGLTSPSFADTGRVNTKTYYYYVLARDPSGFQSAWSNLNSDCASAGPDCVSATPLNPNPPSAPTGVQLQDLGVGTALRVVWSANPENDLARYTVHWGTASGSYGQSTNTGLQTVATLTDLVEGDTYYVAVTATNTSGRTSAFSNEVADYPIYGLGLRGPHWIMDLRARRSGSNVVLEWSEIATDYYGKPENVASYEVLRGSSSNFDPAAMTVIGSCPSPCDTFTDPGAATAVASYHYRVRAIDVDGNAGGLGSNPPAVVTAFVARSTTVPGNIVLSWAPVTTTVDGAPAQIAQYRVYASDQPFTRTDIRNGLLTPVATVAAPPYEFTPPPQSRYHSVIAVDSRGNLSPD